MDWDEPLVLLTIGAVAPYVTVAATGWIKHLGKLNIGAHAPVWHLFPKYKGRKESGRFA